MKFHELLSMSRALDGVQPWSATYQFPGAAQRPHTTLQTVNDLPPLADEVAERAAGSRPGLGLRLAPSSAGDWFRTAFLAALALGCVAAMGMREIADEALRLEHGHEARLQQGLARHYARKADQYRAKLLCATQSQGLDEPAQSAANLVCVGVRSSTESVAGAVNTPPPVMNAGLKTPRRSNLRAGAAAGVKPPLVAANNRRQHASAGRSAQPAPPAVLAASPLQQHSRPRTGAVVSLNPPAGNGVVTAQADRSARIQGALRDAEKVYAIAAVSRLPQVAAR